MPATNYTPILLYRTATASTTAPAAGNLNFGELAINYNASGMILYAKNASGSVIKLMNNPANLLYPTADGSANQAIVTNGSGTLSFASVTTSPGGSTTQVQYNNAGAFAGSANFVWDNSNVRLGIGTSAPAKPFNLVTSGTTEAWFESTSTQKAILSLYAGDNAIGITSTYNSGGTAARPFVFNNVSTSLLQFDLGKTVALQGATTQTGTGITFPATQSASTDANTLDDYEEGTWTPNVGGTATYTTQTASYTKIGNTVVVWGEITINLIGTGSTTRVYGLPFTSNGSYVQPGSTGYFANLAQSVYSMTTAVEPGTTNLVFHTQTSLSGTNNINQAVLGNSARIQFSVTYKV